MEGPDKTKQNKKAEGGIGSERSVYPEPSNGDEVVVEMDEGRRRPMEKNLDAKIQHARNN